MERRRCPEEPAQFGVQLRDNRCEAFILLQARIGHSQPIALTKDDSDGWPSPAATTRLNSSDPNETVRSHVRAAGTKKKPMSLIRRAGKLVVLFGEHIVDRIVIVEIPQRFHFQRRPVEPGGEGDLAGETPTLSAIETVDQLTSPKVYGRARRKDLSLGPQDRFSRNTNLAELVPLRFYPGAHE